MRAYAVLLFPLAMMLAGCDSYRLSAHMIERSVEHCERHGGLSHIVVFSPEESSMIHCKDGSAIPYIKLKEK